MIAMMEKTVKSLKHCADVMFFKREQPFAQHSKENHYEIATVCRCPNICPLPQICPSPMTAHTVRVSVRRKIWKPYHTLSITVQPLIYLET